MVDDRICSALGLDCLFLVLSDAGPAKSPWTDVATCHFQRVNLDPSWLYFPNRNKICKSTS